MKQEPHHRESAQARAPSVGLHVVTRDGQELGVVKDVTEDAFEVDAPRERDYWLSNTLVLPKSSGARAITMDFDADGLDAFKLPGPAPVQVDDPVGDATSDQYADASERARKRHDMKIGHEDETGREDRS